MPGRTTGLVGRAVECELIDGLLADAGRGQSRVLVVRGEAGIGKTALLEHAIGAATGYRVARVLGVESEMQLAFAGLHQLCAPMLDRLSLLPGPQREALSTAFALTGGPPPGRYLVGLALLSLLTGGSDQSPMLVIVDNAQWLDLASAHALAFVARRLLADPVCLVFGTRHLTEDLRGLPELVVEGLGDRDAAALLSSVLPGPLDSQVRQRLIAETRGNPLALLEWPRGLAASELAGGFGLPTLLPLTGQIEESFRRRLSELPSLAQRFLLLAAAEPTGDAALLWRAAGHLGLTASDATPAVGAGLIELGITVRFPHPSVRSAIYGAASTTDRRAAHAALAKATDPRDDAVRQVWHLALAAAGPDEALAVRLERSADEAQSRGGVSAAAALLERSGALTVDAALRAGRTIAAAGAYIDAGAPEVGGRLLSAAEAGHLDVPSRARVDVLRAYAASLWGRYDEAAALFLSAATRLHNIDDGMARDLHLIAMGAAVDASNLTRGVTLEAAAAAAGALPGLSGPERPQDLLLDGFAAFALEGPDTAAPILRDALSAFQRAPRGPTTTGGGPSPGVMEASQWSLFQCGAAVALWDLMTYEVRAQSEVDLARKLGALRTLPNALNILACGKVYAGDLPSAAALVGEAASILEETAGELTLYAAALLAGIQGRGTQAAEVIEAAIRHADTRGQGAAKKVSQFALAALYNGMGRYADACAVAQEADQPPVGWASYVTLHELVEAATRAGHHGAAAEALRRLSVSARASGSDWALGIEARSRALLSAGQTAESLYLDAIERLERSPARPEAARAHLLYGEWLRREGRRVEARRQLRSAHEGLSILGMEAFAERAARELAATGETARKRTPGATTALTAQELQVAHFAAEGCTNAEIAAQLFISVRTVEWHLSKVLMKLEVRSRRGIRERLSGAALPAS